MLLAHKLLRASPLRRDQLAGSTPPGVQSFVCLTDPAGNRAGEDAASGFPLLYWWETEEKAEEEETPRVSWQDGGGHNRKPSLCRKNEWVFSTSRITLVVCSLQIAGDGDVLHHRTANHSTAVLRKHGEMLRQALQIAERKSRRTDIASL